jgi:hypothetical protein
MTPKPRKLARNRASFPTPCADRLARLPLIELAVGRNVRLAELALSGD